MTRQEFVDLLQHLSSGWKERHYADIIGRFAPDVLYVDPLRYRFTDRTVLLQFFQDDAGAEQTVDFHHVLFDEADQIGMVEYSYRGSFLYHGVVVVKMVAGLIQEWREFQHTSPLPWEQFFRESTFDGPDSRPEDSRRRNCHLDELLGRLQVSVNPSGGPAGGATDSAGQSRASLATVENLARLLSEADGDAIDLYEAEAKGIRDWFSPAAFMRFQKAFLAFDLPEAGRLLRETMARTAVETDSGLVPGPERQKS
jgi:hypothetical protein